MASVHDPILAVLLLSSTLFFLCWCGTYWAIPDILASRARSSFLGACMNLASNIAAITVPVIVGLIVQPIGSYFLPSCSSPSRESCSSPASPRSTTAANYPSEPLLLS